LNPPFPVRFLPLFPVFSAEDLGEKESVLRNREKIGEEVDGTRIDEVNLR
jgi:hypothetical protein